LKEKDSASGDVKPSDLPESKTDQAKDLATTGAKAFASRVDARKERKAGKREKQMENLKKLSTSLRSRATLTGTSFDVPQLWRGAPCWLDLDEDGIELRETGLRRGDEPPLLAVPWETVLMVTVDDASEIERKSRIEHHSYGFFGGMFNEMPVERTREKKKLKAYMAVSCTRGQFLLEVLGHDPKDVEGRLLGSRHKWAQAEPEEPAGSPEVDPMEQLQKLGELRDAGVLTDAEFDTKKTDLLRRI
jgi:hypothetical protein